MRVLDGNHQPGIEYRLKPLRTERTGVLPRLALVILDPESMLVVDAISCEDCHAQARSITDEVLAVVVAGDHWVGDRNFRTTALLFEVVDRSGSFAIRQLGSTPTWEACGIRQARGRCETGEVFEQAGRRTLGRTAGQGGVGPADPRRRPRNPYPDGPAQAAANSVTVVDLYRRRWTPETALQGVEATLNGEIDAQGYPRAALFALCVALVAYNLLSAIKGALRSVNGAKAMDEGASGSDLAEDWFGRGDRGLERAAGSGAGWCPTGDIGDAKGDLG